jgi:hypothetical protein
MNINGVLANRASELHGGVLDTNTPVHCQRHVNLGQRANDLFPRRRTSPRCSRSAAARRWVSIHVLAGRAVLRSCGVGWAYGGVVVAGTWTEREQVP